MMKDFEVGDLVTDGFLHLAPRYFYEVTACMGGIVTVATVYSVYENLIMLNPLRTEFNSYQFKCLTLAQYLMYLKAKEECHA